MKNSVWFLYCTGILWVMTTDSFVTGAKSVTTTALGGGEAESWRLCADG